MTVHGRRSLALVQPVRLTGTPDWATGPLPLRAGTTTASTASRAGYFTPASARILYGTPTRPSRWHAFLPDTPADSPPDADDAHRSEDGATDRERAGGGDGPIGTRSDGFFGSRGLFGVEVLLPDPEVDPHSGLAIWHLAAGEDQLELLRAVAGRPTDLTPPDLAATIAPFAVPVAGVRPFTIAFRSQTGARLARPRGISRRLDWTPAQAWLWLLASRTEPGDYPPDPDHADRLLTGTISLSADWRGLITRDGAAFVALRPDHGATDPFLGHAQLYAHTTYLDALLLGMVQRASVEQMVTDSAAAFDAPDLSRHLEQLQGRAARFRTIYWLRDAGSHGPANDILDAYQAQHGLPERFDAVLTEIADLSRIVQEQQAQRTGAALGVLTIVGLPFGITFELLQTLGLGSLTALVLGLTAAG